MKLKVTFRMDGNQKGTSKEQRTRRIEKTHYELIRDYHHLMTLGKFKAIM